MFPGLSHCATLPNAHVYHQKPLFVPSRRKHVIASSLSLQLIPEFLMPALPPRWIGQYLIPDRFGGSAQRSFLQGVFVHNLN